MVEAQGGQIFLIHDHDKLAAPLDEGHIGFDQPGIGAVKSLAGTRIETANEVDGVLDGFRLRAQHLGHLAQVALLQQQQMLINNAGGERKHLQPDFVQTQRLGGLTFCRHWSQPAAAADAAR